MQKNKNIFKILIFILAGLVIFQAVSIGVLLVKNMKLKQAFSRKAQRPVSSAKKAWVIKIPEGPSGNVAIVLDDWGYNTKNLKALLGLKKPITVSILPSLPYSKTIAEAAKKNNVEVILHLPLEAHDMQKRPEKGTINTNMGEKEILARLQGAFDTVPYIKGVSNHMGSKATEDKNLMRILFAQFQTKNLHFPDSLVSNYSVCPQIAGEAGIKFAQRSIFLDNNNDAEYIKGQLIQLMIIAKKKKTVIAIGHDRPGTIKAIKEMLPEFQREGVKLVYLSEVVR